MKKLIVCSLQREIPGSLWQTGYNCLIQGQQRDESSHCFSASTQSISSWLLFRRFCLGPGPAASVCVSNPDWITDSIPQLPLIEDSCFLGQNMFVQGQSIIQISLRWEIEDPVTSLITDALTTGNHTLTDLITDHFTDSHSQSHVFFQMLNTSIPWAV